MRYMPGHGPPGRMPHPAPCAFSPSADHIIPLSLGGLHSPASVGINHLQCNVETNNGKERDNEEAFPPAGQANSPVLVACHGTGAGGWGVPVLGTDRRRRSDHAAGRAAGDAGQGSWRHSDHGPWRLPLER